ncbi:hypothetical protein P3S68_021535 [Capsicum galapagoense]
MRDIDKASAAAKEKLSLSKPNLDEIKSYVKTYVAQYPVHESEKEDPNIERDPSQSLNKHKTNAKSDNVVDDAGQSSKLGGNEGASEESLKEVESSYRHKLQEDDRHNTDVEVDEGIRKEHVKESEEDLQKIDNDLSKVITLYVPPSPVTYPTGNTDSQCYISDSVIAAISQVPVCKNNLIYVRKNPSKRNRQPSKLYQSPFVSVFDSGSKYKEAIQSHKK